MVDFNLDGTTTPTTFPVAIGGLPAVTFVPLAAIPEPSSLLLLLAGLLGLFGAAVVRRGALQAARAKA